MTRWRSVCAATAITLLVAGAVGGCASDDGAREIEGKVDFVPADTSQRAASANAGTNAAFAAGSATSGNPANPANPAHSAVGQDRKSCTASVRASNALLDKRVVALFPAKALRRVEHLTPADTFHCDPREGPDFGGVSALWKDITGARAIEVLTADGWTREDPATGEPAWASQGLPHGDGSLNYEPAEQYVVTFHLSRGGRQFWAELTQDGMRSGLDDAA